MQITVRYFLEYAEISGHRSEELSFSSDQVSVSDVFSRLAEKYNLTYRDVITSGMVMVNNTSVTQLEEEKTRLQDGDRMMLMPMLAGG